MAKMKTLELEGLLGRLQENAVGSFAASIGGERADLMKRYLAKAYGDEVAGRSTIVDTTCRDTVESIKPEIMDIFMGGDNVVEFTGQGAEDMEAAEQETTACNYIFQRANPGFMILYNWVTDALMQKNGYVKRFWDERKRVEVEEYDELTPEEAANLLAELEESSDEVDILERSGGIELEEVQGEFGPEMQQKVTPLYLKIRRTSTEKRYTIENVPPEEVLVHPQWKSVSFTGCPYVAHKRAVTVSELVQMGFDRKQVEKLPAYDRRLESQEAAERFTDENFYEGDPDTTDMAMREVLVYENYALIDRDGDGIAEQIQVFTGDDGKILKRYGRLAIEEVTDAPFEVMTSMPIPHRHYGMCVAELVTDLQKLKTVMTRQLADNIVGSNNPDLVYDEDVATPATKQALQFNGLGRNIPIPGGPASTAYMQVPQTAQQSLAAIEYIDQLKESRTGVSRFNQGLDPNSIRDLSQQTVKNFSTAAQKKILMIARIFAETGFASLFMNMHRDLRAGPMKKLSIKLNNEYVEVNPRTWRHRTDLTVNVGLGTGDRDIQLARLGSVYAEQKELFAAGLIGYDRVYHTLSVMLELSGFKDVDNFLPDPDEVEARQQAAAANAKPTTDELFAQIEQMKVQMKGQADAQKNAIDRMKIDNDRLKILMEDDRQRDLKAADIEAEEAARKAESVDGKKLTNGSRSQSSAR